MIGIYECCISNDIVPIIIYNLNNVSTKLYPQFYLLDIDIIEEHVWLGSICILGRILYILTKPFAWVLSTCTI